MSRIFNGSREEISAIIGSALSAYAVGSRRGSESRIVPLLRSSLASAGFEASTKYRLPGPIRLGRDPLTGKLRQSLAWAEADIAVYRDGTLAGIIESEHDLAWIVPHGAPSPRSSSAWRYAMSSIASDESGSPFSSYSPLERMAYIANWQGDAQSTEALLTNICTNRVDAHNPQGIPFFLISELPDRRSEIIKPRMQSLGVLYLEAS